MAEQDYRAIDYGAYRGAWVPAPPGAGWIAFTSTMLGLAGGWNVIQGLLAVGSSKVYVGEASFVFGDLRTWGWIIMALGIVQCVAAFAVAGGSEAARWFGIGVAFVNAIGQLSFVDAAPWWAATVFALDVLVIYGLAVYGGSRTQTV